MGRHRLTVEERRVPSVTPDLAAFDAASAWAWVAGELSIAAGSARHPFHLLTLATVTPDGQPDTRTVVLRHFDPTARLIRFHTDIRSPKVQAIRAEPRVALHWYDPPLRVQLRTTARATIHHGDAHAAAAWAAAAPMSRAYYTTAAAPGSAVDAFPEGPPAPDPGDDTGRDRFAVVSCRLEAFDVLALHAAGHQRVRLLLDHDRVAWTVLAP